MKRKSKQRIFRNYKFLFIFFFLASFVILNSCSETVSPTGTTKRVVTVTTYLNDVTKGKPTSDPALGAQIQLFDTKNNVKDVLLLSDIASNGMAKLTFQAPVAGHKYIVEASYNSQLNAAGLYPCCKDTNVSFWFNVDPPPQIKCDSIPGLSDSLIFRGTNNSDTLTKGTSEVSQCKTLFTNVGTQAVRVIVPAVKAPFRLISTNPAAALTAGNTIDLLPGESFTVCIGFNTAADVGSYTQNMNFNVNCQTTNSVIKLLLKANLAQPQCKCPPSNIVPVTKTDRVPIGNTQQYTDAVFVNNLACCINGITVTDLNNIGEWTILNDYSNKTINPGESIDLTSRFNPQYVKSRPDTFRVTYNLCSGGQCSFLVVYAGQGCYPFCPEIEINQKKFQFDGTLQTVINYNARDSRTSFSKDVSCFKQRSMAIVNLPISLSDSACDNSVTISVTVSDTEQTQLSKPMFRVSPASFTIQPGQTQNLQIQFEAPTIKEFESIFINNKRVKKGTTEDSTFTVFITLTSSSPNCRIQRIKAYAILTTVPKISPVRNLRAYRQATDLKPTPENEIYCFDCLTNDVFTDLVTTLRKPDGTAGPYPPNQGDMYVDVTDPTAASPPVDKQPHIFILQSGLFNCIKRWQGFMLENNFDNTMATIKALQNDYLAGTFDFNTGCATSVGSDIPANGLKPGEVYVVWSSSKDASTGLPCNIGLLYIRQINLGTEQNTNHQTAVEFRTIYPVMF